MSETSKQAALHFLRVIVAAMIVAGLDAAVQWFGANQSSLQPWQTVVGVALLSAVGKTLREWGVLNWPAKVL